MVEAKDARHFTLLGEDAYSATAWPSRVETTASCPNSPRRGGCCERFVKIVLVIP
jgi:hypothetical protein